MTTNTGVETGNLPELDESENEPLVLQQEREIYEKHTTDQTEVPFSQLEWIENVRSEKGMLLEKMVHSLKQRGYNTKYPVVVHKVSSKKYRVLCGNRRTLALKQIQEAEPGIFKVVLPNGKVPAIVLEGLTDDQEGVLLVDHSDAEDRVALDDEGLFHAVVRLMRSNVKTQSDIAAKLNLYKEKDGKLEPNRSLIQQRVNLARLPEEVQQEFLKMMREGTKATPVRWGQVATLYKHFREGRDAGDPTGGQKFKEYWEQCLSPEKQEKSPSMVSKKQLEDKVENFNSRNGLRFANLVMGKEQKDDDGNAITDLQIIDNEITELEKAAELLNDIREHMGATKFDKMVKEITAAKIKAAEEAEKAADDE